MSKKQINPVTDYDAEKGELTVQLKALFGTSPEEIKFTTAHVKRLIIQQLADEWIRQNGEQILGDFTAAQLTQLMRDEVVHRFVSSRLSGL